MSSGSRWLVFGLKVMGWALIVMGWALWVVGVVFLVFCEGIQSNPGIAAPGDPCRDLRGLVFGGFVFLLVTSVVALKLSSKQRRWDPDDPSRPPRSTK